MPKEKSAPARQLIPFAFCCGNLQRLPVSNYIRLRLIMCAIFIGVMAGLPADFGTANRTAIFCRIIFG